jgi:preprotein translocase subunit SecG
MEEIILVIHVIAAIALIGFILIQHGKGAEVGASFGSGASQTLFGSQGSGNFLTRATAILVTVFFITSLALGYLASHHAKPKDLDELLKRVQPETVKQDNEIPEVVPGVNKNETSGQK